MFAIFQSGFFDVMNIKFVLSNEKDGAGVELVSEIFVIFLGWMMHMISYLVLVR